MPFKISKHDLQEGMILKENLLNQDGVAIASMGKIVDQEILEDVKSAITESISVDIPNAEEKVSSEEVIVVQENLNQKFINPESNLTQILIGLCKSYKLKKVYFSKFKN
ncbi:MAG: hypothetical protein AAF984_06330 [Verrucomicrobiota bacterium]